MAVNRDLKIVRMGATIRGMSNSRSGNNSRRMASYTVALLLLSLVCLGLYSRAMANTFGSTTSDTMQGSMDAPSGTLHHLVISMDERIVRILNQTSSATIDCFGLTKSLLLKPLSNKNAAY